MHNTHSTRTQINFKCQNVRFQNAERKFPNLAHTIELELNSGDYELIGFSAKWTETS